LRKHRKYSDQNWFILPPVMAWYYKSQHIEYLPLPHRSEVIVWEQTATMDFIYPKTNNKNLP
jgi:penicillin-binding protein 1C